MNAWLYARLSNDDDPEMDSLANQMEICKEFALGQGYSIVGSSFDDNVSGMKFRPPCSSTICGRRMWQSFP